MGRVGWWQDQLRNVQGPMQSQNVGPCSKIIKNFKLAFLAGHQTERGPLSSHAHEARMAEKRDRQDWGGPGRVGAGNVVLSPLPSHR